MSLVKLGLVGGVLAGTAVTARGLAARDWTLRAEDEQQLRVAFGIAVLALLTASLLRDLLSLPLLVATAALAGWIPVRVCQVPRVADRLRAVCGGPHRARATGWFVIAVCALAATEGLLTFRIATALFGVAMAIWNTRQIALEQE